jgi:NDP-sugar pyrophosphorylase family protein
MDFELDDAVPRRRLQHLIMSESPLAKAVVLAGGLGTRLRPLTYSIPKPLMPVGKKPILEWLLSALRRAGVTEAIIATGYQSEMIAAYFRDGDRVGLRLTYFSEPEPMGTAGPLTALANMLPEPFFLINGDILTRMNFAALYEAHLASGADLTVAVREHRWQLPFGAVTVEGSRIVDIREKPIVSNLISAGIYVLSPTAITLIPPRCRYDMPQLIRRLAAEGRVGCHFFDDYWLDVGTAQELDAAALEAERWDEDGRVPLPVETPR